MRFRKRNSAMPEGNEVPVSRMKSGQSGKITSIQGGPGIASRLSALGIRQGQTVTKISSMLLRGPITVQAGQTRIAIGYGMANKIFVELD